MVVVFKKNRDVGSQPWKLAILKKLFEGRKYRIVREINLGPNERFQTPLGNKGRNGFLLEEIGSDPAFRIVFGAYVLEKAAEEYGAVDLGVRKPKRYRRTKAEKWSDDVAAAKKTLAEAARLVTELEDTAKIQEALRVIEGMTIPRW